MTKTKTIIRLLAAVTILWFVLAAAASAFTVTHTHNSCSGNHSFQANGLTGHANIVAYVIYPFKNSYQGHYTKASPSSPWVFIHQHQTNTNKTLVCW